MMDLDQPLEAAGASLYADHADPGLYHLLPGPPRVRSATLTVWRGAVTGGRLDLELDLTHSAERLAAVHEALSRRPRPARAIPALLAGGDAQLHVADALALRVVSATRIGSASPWSLIFSVSLDAEMATLVEAAAGGGLPLVVVASAEVQGLLPSRRARIEAEARACQEALQERFALESLWLRSRREAAVESLIQSGHVRITDLATAVEDPLTRAFDLRAIATDLLSAELWRPVPTPPGENGGPTTGAAEVTRPAALVGVGYRLREVDSEAERHLSWDLSASVPMSRTLHAQAYVDAAALRVLRVDLDQDPFFLHRQPLRVIVPEGADWTGIERVLAEVRRGEDAGAAVLSASAPRAEIGVPGPNREVRVRVDATPAVDDLVGALPAEVVLSVDGDVLLLDPAALAGRRTLDVEVLAPGDGVLLDGEVRLGLGDAAASRRLDGPVRFVVWGPGPLVGEARFGLTPPGGARVENVVARQIPTGETRWWVSPPEDGMEVSTFGLADPLSRYAAVLVEIADPPRVLRLSAEEPFARLVRLRPATRLRYRVRRVGRDGRETPSDWVESDQRVFPVGDPHLRLARVQVALRDGGDHVGGVLHLENLRAPSGAPAAVDVSIDTGARLVEVRLATGPDGAWAGFVEATVFDATGGLRTGRVEVEGEEIVVLKLDA